MTTALGDVEHKVASSRALAIGIAAASAGAGLLHLAYAPEHLATQTSHGMFFLVVAWFQIVASALIIFGRAPRWAMFTIVAVNAAVLIVWIVSRTAGIDGVVEQVGMPDALAGIFEVIVIGGATLLAMGWAGPMISETALGASVGVSLAGVVALVSVALVPPLGGGHSEAAGHGNSATSAVKAHDDSMATDEHPQDAASTDERPHDDTVEVAGANTTKTTQGHTDGMMNTTGGTTDTTHGQTDGMMNTTGGTTDTTHGHTNGTTTTTTGHTNGTTTTTTGHTNHVTPPPGEDWATIRRTALIGGASAAKQATVTAASRDYLEMNLRTRSSFLRSLSEADREARIDAFASWQIDHVLDVEHGDSAVGNHVDGPLAWVATSPADSVTLMHQLHAAADTAALYPTAQHAMNAGYFQVTSWIPGIGAHYLKPSYVSTFDAAKPSILLYNGNKPSSVLVGLSYAVVSSLAPEGFAGTNDAWHVHPALCLLAAYVVGSDATPDDLCSSVGASKGSGFGTGSKFWMMHLWQVPNWWSQWGLFSSESTSINVERTDVGT